MSETKSSPSRPYKSMDRGIDEMVLGGAGQDTPPGGTTMEGRRASTGEIQIPTEVASVDSQPQIIEDGEYKRSNTVQVEKLQI